MKLWWCAAVLAAVFSSGGRAQEPRVTQETTPIFVCGQDETMPRLPLHWTNVVLAGDGIRCDWPVALMERAATTGWLAANRLLAGWGLPAHDLWTVPTRGRHRVVPPLRRRLFGAPGQARARRR